MQQLPSSLSGFRGLRAELLIALKKAPQPPTAKELAEQFGLTPNALRRHLEQLEAEELVRHRREVRGVGAPVHAYSLTPGGQALFPQAYAPVLAAVLEAVREAAGPEGVRRAIARQWAGLVEGARERLAELPLPERAQLIAELRSSQGYMAEAESLGEDGAVIREHHCAIRDVAERFPEICQAEQELMEQLLGVPVERTGHMLDGCTACEYHARLPAVVPAPVLAAEPTCCTPEELAGAAPCTACAATHRTEPAGLPAGAHHSITYHPASLAGRVSEEQA